MHPPPSIYIVRKHFKHASSHDLLFLSTNLTPVLFIIPERKNDENNLIIAKCFVS